MITNRLPAFLLLTLASMLLLPDLHAQSEKNYAYDVFRGTRVINGHSTEMLRNGELDFIISHRFGKLGGGLYDLFGLDQSSVRFGLEYGMQDWLNVGVGRSSYGKHYDSYVKLRLLQQGIGGGSPVTVDWFSSAAISTLRPAIDSLPVPVQTRLAYTHQLLISRKFSDRLSVQLMPSVVHYNLVEHAYQPNDIWALGAAVRYKVSMNVAVMGEYYYVFPGQLPDDRRPSLALGVDINTGGHVFQLQLTNSMAMIEKGFISETTDQWLQGGIHLGFNISRTFKVKGRRY